MKKQSLNLKRLRAKRERIFKESLRSKSLSSPLRRKKWKFFVASKKIKLKKC